MATHGTTTLYLSFVKNKALEHEVQHQHSSTSNEMQHFSQHIAETLLASENMIMEDPKENSKKSGNQSP